MLGLGRPPFAGVGGACVVSVTKPIVEWRGSGICGGAGGAGVAVAMVNVNSGLDVEGSCRMWVGSSGDG